jgi:pimeloyl-ACP methyl ester carboxylesterase
MPRINRATTVILLGLLAEISKVPGPYAQAGTAMGAGLHRIEVPSTTDGSMQRSYLVVPSSGAASSGRMPLVVILHTWSSDLEARFTRIENDVVPRGWLALTPNFRGQNNHPQACGSLLAQQDILDAIAWVRSRFPVDEKRIYLVGWSGGGFMALLMASRYPNIWAAASVGAGISDLQAWYEEHQGDTFGSDLRACFGGAPSDSESIARRYREQSPITYLRPDLDVPLDLAAGKDDPVVSVRHTLKAFRALAPDALSEQEIANLLTGAANLHQVADRDALIPRRLYLRRTAGEARVTVFDGKHEWFYRASLEWLERHHRR